MKDVREDQYVNMTIKMDYQGIVHEEETTLGELGWNGQQGEELEAFMNHVRDRWTLAMVESDIEFVD